ncbi:succinyl-CoA:3-ketoacid coenzyme A transferase subunit A [Deltaproteobacteria bacterium]|nr:succinyl-CoA:3-ketoacid coenzyme A transferase subunit A [Deltaproteobacteria bacterium]
MKSINKVLNIRDAIARIKDGDRIMVGGFGLRGTPDPLVDALVEHHATGLTIISNDLGSPGVGLGKLLRNKKIKNLIGNYYNWNPEVAEAYNAGEIGVTLVPQGTLAESIRAAGVGIPAYYTPTAAGTELGNGKEAREFNGRMYVLEEAVKADVALIKACKADTLGNLVYCKVARNFNPAMAMAADYTIALVSEIVEPGELDPESIVTAHIFVNAIVKEAK